MKTLTTFGIALLTSLSQIAAQNLFTSSYIEKTHVSPKAGIQVGYRFSTNHEVGIFYQKEVDMPGSREAKKPRFYEKEFLGVNLSAQLISFHKVNMLIDIRIGVINKENFGLTPSLKFDYEIIKRVHLNAGIGARTFTPTYQGGIKIDIY